MSSYRETHLDEHGDEVCTDHGTYLPCRHCAWDEGYAQPKRKWGDAPGLVTLCGDCEAWHAVCRTCAPVGRRPAFVAEEVTEYDTHAAALEALIEHQRAVHTSERSGA